MAADGASSQTISHWYQLFEGLTVSSQEFYESVAVAVELRNLPNTTRYRIRRPEAGPLSSKREYLRVLRYNHYFDICAGHFGNGFFVSWWLGEIPSGCLTFFTWVPIVGPRLEQWFRPATYYRIDTALMFQESVHRAVLEVIDSLTSAKGLRSLSEAERKPIHHKFT